MDIDQLTQRHPWLGHLECSHGWIDLIHALAGAIEERFTQQAVAVGPQTLRALQVKEKFGALRVYLHSTVDVDDLLEDAQALSLRLCCICGQAGRLRSAGYRQVLCDAHATC